MFDNVKQFFRKRLQNAIGSAIQSAFSTRGFGQPVFNGVDLDSLLKNGYQGNADVFSIIDHISTVASSIPWTLSEVKDEKVLNTYKNYNGLDVKSETMRVKALEQITSHPLIDTWDRPNKLQTGSEWRYNWCGFKLSTGNAFVHGVSPAIGINKEMFQELFMMPSQHVEILPGNMMDPIRGYLLDVGHKKLPFESGSVNHSKYFNPSYRNGQSLYGMPPLQSAFRNLSTSNEADVARMKSFENQGAVGMISSSTGDEKSRMSPEELQGLSDKYQEKFGGPENFNKVLFTTAQATWNNMGLSPVDLAILESKVHDLRTLCNVYRVQSQLFNDPENKIASNLKEAEKAMMVNAIMPLLNSMRDEMNMWLVPAYEKAEGRRLFLSPDWKSVAILQEDLQRMVSWLNTAYWITGNQKLEIMGMEKSNDPNMDLRFAPGTLVPLGQGVPGIQILPTPPAAE